MQSAQDIVLGLAQASKECQVSTSHTEVQWTALHMVVFAKQTDSVVFELLHHKNLKVF